MMYMKLFKKEHRLNRFNYRTYRDYVYMHRKRLRLNKNRYVFDQEIEEYVQNPKSIQFVSLRPKDGVK